MSASTAAQALHTQLKGDDVIFTGVSTDSRSLEQGDMFIALKGPNFDGHEHLAAAASAGAAVSIISKTVDTNLPTILVKDTRLALGELAAYWREQFNIPVIAVTGSNGKTTVKEMIALILNVKSQALVTKGNLNNDIGVPKTLLRLREKHQFAVIEMGMNHTGEIHYLTMMTKPDVALITNASDAHIGELGSLQAVAKAKGEIMDGLSSDGTAVLNADDDFIEYWIKQCSGKKTLLFGLENKADIFADYELTQSGSEIYLKTPEGDINMSLSVLGKHNVMNAVAASAASIAAGAELLDIQEGLEKLKAVNGRLELKEGINGTRIIDDTYNANPASLSAALEVLKTSLGERILVLGDMAELGEAGPEIHYRVGELAKRVGVARIFAMGKLSKQTVKAFGKGAHHYSKPRALVEALLDCMHPEATVLVKGSRMMKMEDIVNGIIAK
jgi:UDP-N-acetylmuramoyl-tripeptide--D-alanyl-D-alanine ligase